MNSDDVNKRYRRSDIKRWQGMDFVIGYEVKLSNNPKHDCEMCKRLSGKYPKSFNWDGWHDECRCHVTSLLMNESTTSRRTVSMLRAALRGTEPEDIRDPSEIIFVPESFVDWFLENRKRLNENNEMPDFVTENIRLIMDSYEYYKNKG